MIVIDDVLTRIIGEQETQVAHELAVTRPATELVPDFTP